MQSADSRKVQIRSPLSRSERESAQLSQFLTETADEVFGPSLKTDGTGVIIGCRFVRVKEHNRSVFSSSKIDQWT